MSTQIPESSRRLLPWLVAVAFFMEALDTTILNTAIPVMANALGVAPLSMKAVLASYTLSLAVFIPVSGWIADRFGTRRVFASAIGIFTLGSICCGLSTDIHTLVASRILQGMGGALMLPVGRLTMVKTFPKSDLVRAMSFVALPGLIGPMLGPLAGGLIVTHFHWSVIFFVNVPIGLLGLYMVYRHLPDFREGRSPFDFVGFILFGCGIALLSYVLEVFGEHTLSGREMIALLALAGLLIAGYAVNSSRIAHPLLRTVLFRIRTFRSAVSGSFFSRLGIGGVPFLFPLLYQAGLGFSATHAGLLMMVPASAAFSLKLSMPTVLARFGYRSILVFNTVVLGLMIMLFATIGANTPIWLIVIQLFLFGACASLQYTSMNTLVYADVADKDAGAASTIASTSQQLSVSFAVALASLAAAVFVPEALRTDPPALIGGIHKAFLMLGALTVVSAVVFVRLRPDDGNQISRNKAIMPTEAGSG